MTIMASPINMWLGYYKPKPQAQLRLFCFPYAGGGSSIYRLWSDYLPPEIEVCPVLLPGREVRLQEKPFTRLSPLVLELGQVLPALFDKPFAFFGHSMGALISYELTRFLRQQGYPTPIHLFVSGRRAPHIPPPGPPIHRLPQNLFMRELRRFNGTPQEILRDADLMGMFLPILRADFAICEEYVHTTEEPLACPITAVGGSDDGETAEGRLEAWQQHTSSTFTRHILSGNHFFLHNARAALLRILSDELVAATQQGM